MRRESELEAVAPPGVVVAVHPQGVNISSQGLYAVRYSPRPRADREFYTALARYIERGRCGELAGATTACAQYVSVSFRK